MTVEISSFISHKDARYVNRTNLFVDHPGFCYESGDGSNLTPKLWFFAPQEGGIEFDDYGGEFGHVVLDSVLFPYKGNWKYMDVTK